jgi:hypothetical protein
VLGRHERGSGDDEAQTRESGRRGGATKRMRKDALAPRAAWLQSSAWRASHLEVGLAARQRRSDSENRLVERFSEVLHAEFVALPGSGVTRGPGAGIAVRKADVLLRRVAKSMGDRPTVGIPRQSMNAGRRRSRITGPPSSRAARRA